LLETLERVRGSLNPRLTVDGIVLTMVDGRNNLTRQVEAEVRSHFGDRVYQTKIPRNVRLSEAPSHGMPALLYDPQSSGAKAYTALCYEILNRLELNNPPFHPPALGSKTPATAVPSTSNESPPTGSIRQTHATESGQFSESGESGESTESSATPETTQPAGQPGGSNGQYP